MQEETQQAVAFPDLEDLEPLLSDQEEILQNQRVAWQLHHQERSHNCCRTQPWQTLANFPLFSSRAGSLEGPESTDENEPQEETDREVQAPGQSPATMLTPDRTVRRKGQPRGQPRVVKEEVQLQQLQERTDNTLDQEVE